MSFGALDGGVKLPVFADRCSVEIFGNAGAAYLADLIFPNWYAHKLEVYTDGGIVARSADLLHRLRSMTAVGGR